MVLHARINAFSRPSEHGGYTGRSRGRKQINFQACVEHDGPITSNRTGGGGHAECCHGKGGIAYIRLRYSAECSPEGVNGLQVERPYTVRFNLVTCGHVDKLVQQESRPCVIDHALKSKLLRDILPDCSRVMFRYASLSSWLNTVQRQYGQMNDEPFSTA